MNTVIVNSDAREEARKSVQDKIANLSMDDLVTEFTNLVVGSKQVQLTLDNCRNMIYRFESVVEDFIKTNYEDPSDIDKEDLAKLAAKLDISVKKEITATFTVKYTGEFTVPIDFDTDSIKEGDFTFSAEMSSTFDDLDVESEVAEMEDFEVEED